MSPPTLGPEITTSPLGDLPGSGHSSFMQMPKRNGSLSSSSMMMTSLNGSATSKENGGKPAAVPMMRRSTSQSSTSSIVFGNGEVELVTEEGVRHADGKLEARKYKTPAFADTLLDLILKLRVPTWLSVPEGELVSGELKVSKVSGSLTNAVFFVSYPSKPTLKTILLRIYGPSSSNLISRPRELHTLHILSSGYRIGPRVYGTFENGRMEEYFDSVTLCDSDLRDPKISRWIGARMAELHCVDIEAVECTTETTRGENVGWEIAAKKNVKSWLTHARQVLALPAVSQRYRDEIKLEEFAKEWERYMAWVKDWEKTHGASKRVFAHNDAQYGNLLCLSKLKEGAPEHHRIIVVDFEYAAPNPAAFDIANHFHEWTADYHSSTPHILRPSQYPSPSDRQNFYAAYLKHACPPLTTVPSSSSSSTSSFSTTPLTNGTSTPNGISSSSPACLSSAASQEIPMEIDVEMDRLEDQVRVWSPASHAMWAIWGIVQAMEDMKNASSNPEVLQNLEFDYLGYAKCRMQGFRREIAALGLSS